jgi:hypothetical protein
MLDVIRAPLFVVNAEEIFVGDVPLVGWHKTISDIFVLTDLSSKILGLIIPDWMTLMDVQENRWKGIEVLNDPMVILDYYVFAQYLKNIADTMDLVDLPRVLLTMLINDIFTVVDVVSEFGKWYLSVAETIVAVDETSKSFDKTIAESMVSTDLVAELASFGLTVADALVIVETALRTYIMKNTVSETMMVADVNMVLTRIQNVLEDTFHFDGTIELTGEIWECWVLNTSKFMPSIYSGFNFNSYCVYEGKAFGANDMGIYELTGLTDVGAPIHTGVILSETDFGLSNQKRFRRGYLDISGDGPVMVFKTESSQQEVYEIDSDGKTIMSSDLKSKKWKISVADFDTLDHIKLIPVILTK